MAGDSESLGDFWSLGPCTLLQHPAPLPGVPGLGTGRIGCFTCRKLCSLLFRFTFGVIGPLSHWHLGAEYYVQARHVCVK